MTQCLIISAKDNVAVAAVTDVPIYHKIAIRPIEEGAPVIKYGCVIGVAAKSIEAGAHVHCHNTVSCVPGGIS